MCTKVAATTATNKKVNIMAISNRQFDWLSRRMSECYDFVNCSYEPHDYEHMLELFKQSKVLSNFNVVQVWDEGIEFKFVYSDEWVTGYFKYGGHGFDITDKTHYHPYFGFISIR